MAISWMIVIFGMIFYFVSYRCVVCAMPFKYKNCVGIISDTGLFVRNEGF